MKQAKSTVSNPAPKAARRPRKKTKGALAAVGGLLIASAALRITVGAGEAFAKEDTAPGATEPLAEARAAAPEPVVMQASEPEVVALLERLSAREERVKKRELAIEVRMQALAVAEKEIDRRLKTLEDAEESLRATLALAETAAEDDLTQLTQVYANMKPKQAAALFNQMDPQFAAGFLGRMRAESAADIMASMTPETAYLVSVILAGRNANVPKE